MQRGNWNPSVCNWNNAKRKDAHESLMYIIQVRNKGSAWCPLADSDAGIDANLIQSFTKYMFQFMFETTRICCYCNSGKTTQEIDSLFNVAPTRGASIQSMIEDYCISQMIMFCSKCKKDRQYICNIDIKELPRVLIIVLKRFDKRSKVTLPVCLEKAVKINQCKYNYCQLFIITAWLKTADIIQHLQCTDNCSIVTMIKFQFKSISHCLRHLQHMWLSTGNVNGCSSSIKRLSGW